LVVSYGAGGNGIVQGLETPLVTQPRSDTRYYFLKDHLGSVRVTVDVSGNVTSYDDFYPFGMTMDGRSGNIGSGDARYKYTTKERDAESGYDYFGARYYDARIGRWLNVDPIAEKYRGWSPYAYSRCNPISFFDPNGLWTDPVNKPTYRSWYANNTWNSDRSHFGMVRSNGTKPHQGVDLTAAVGTQIRAVEDGEIVRVITSGGEVSFGSVIMLKFTNRNGDTRYAQYAHLSQINVNVGDKVKEGTVIGETGMSGNASALDAWAAHLHFGIAKSVSPSYGLEDYDDPTWYMTIQTPEGPVQAPDQDSNEEGSSLDNASDWREHISKVRGIWNEENHDVPIL
jgi:RHS repeat-associated protein